VILRPPNFGAFKFVVLSGLRAHQLQRGCIPRVLGTHKLIMIAQSEVAEGKVTELLGADDPTAPVAVAR
jgi:DNA-directed RNA polymerase subunit K/omega